MRACPEDQSHPVTFLAAHTPLWMVGSRLAMPPFPGAWAEIVARVRENDDEAAEVLIQQLYPMVLRIARAHRPSRMAEEDLCQEIFLGVFRSLGQFRGAVPFEHWVSRIAVNTCIDHLRRQRSRPEVRWADLNENEAQTLQALAADTAEPSAEQNVAARDLVARLLETLDPKDRALIQWFELEDRTVAEVSRLTGWNATLVKVRAFRARRRLRRALDTLLGSSPALS